MILTEPSCAAQTGSWCQRVWEITQVEWLSVAADTLLGPVLRILLIVAVAIVLRALVHRLVERVTRMTATGMPVPDTLVPWRDRVDAGLLGPSMLTRRRERAHAIGSLLKSISSFAIVVVATIMVLAELGVDVAPLLASAGIAGVALGFGAQNLVRDFLGGISIILEDQCGVGDVVDLGPASGTVIDMGLRTTTLHGTDGAIWHVRNGEVLRVGNVSQGEAVVDVDLPIPVRIDTRRAADIALAAATKVADSAEFAELVVKPPVLDGMTALTHEAATIRVTSTVRVGSQAVFGRAVRLAVKEAVDSSGLME